jgi:Cdc6-like AAA superfamily ATPase
MNQSSTLLNRIRLAAKTPTPNKRYSKLGLQFNPFPRSGTASINGGDNFNLRLVPVAEKVLDDLLEFIGDALNTNELDSKDKFISAVITGDYGSGKTQLLMFVRAILSEIAAVHKGQKNPYIIYVDNPGVKLLEFIGTIISRVGEENFKKFIWAKVIDGIRSSDEYQKRLEKFRSSSGVLFADTNPNPYAEENTVSYKQFLNSFTRYINNPRSRKEFDETFKDILMRVIEAESGDSLLAQYFYELISDDYGVNKTWESLSTGGIKLLDKKVVEIIRYIVRLIKEQGYTDFFILVDEFEDITRGRLTKPQVDNYLYNLRALVDEHREWCLLFAMTGEALDRLKEVSPPLSDRIGSRIINLPFLKNHEAATIIVNYLNLAREQESDDINPFDLTGIEKLNASAGGNARRLLRGCYYIVERAADELGKNKVIDSEFLTKHFSQEFI